MAEAMQAGLTLLKFEDITERVLLGILKTSARYDAMLDKAPFFIKLFRKTIRATYCAPGTEGYARLTRRQKIYACACWCRKK